MILNPISYKGFAKHLDIQNSIFSFINDTKNSLTSNI